MQRRELAPLLAAAEEHPWPMPLPVTLQGQLGKPDPLSYVPVAPVVVVVVVVVEFGADVAYEGGRYRHLLRYGRVRLDIEPVDITEWTFNLNR